MRASSMLFRSVVVVVASLLIAPHAAAKGSISDDETARASALVKRHFPGVPVPETTTTTHGGSSRVLEDDAVAFFACVPELVVFGDCLADAFGDDGYYYYFDDTFYFYDGIYYYDGLDRYAVCDDVESGTNCLAVFSDVFDDDFLDSGICVPEFDLYMSCYFSIICEQDVSCNSDAPPSGGSKKKKSDDDDSGAVTAIIVVCVLVGLLIGAAIAGYLLGYIHVVLPSRSLKSVSLMVPQHVPGSEPASDSSYAVM